MKILVTGAGGMLGSALIPALVRAGHDVRPTDLRVHFETAWVHLGGAVGLDHLDVTDAEAVAQCVDRVDPDLVMHLAAETDVDLCESQPEHAAEANTLGTAHVTRACQRACLPLVYISTAGVFDGEKDQPYDELDEPRPINVYGRSKLEGEHLVQSLLERYFIVRAGWMVGGGVRDHKFVGKIVQQLQAGARVVYAVDDKFGTPTYAPDLADCLTRLIETDRYGLYHMASCGQGTRYDVARAIIDILGRANDVELVNVPSIFFGQSYPAPRPRSEALRNLMLDRIGMNTMRHWRPALQEYLLTAFADARDSQFVEAAS